MNILLVVGIGALLLFIATRTYPLWIARVFDVNDANPTPAETFADGKDFVKSPSHIVFAHHFASIAGAGPIVGPIIALAFGWGPAWLWIIVGGICFGAVHDMSAMCVSVREGGKTIAEIARRTLGNFGYFLFVAFLLLVISLVNAIFLKLSASALSSMYPLKALGLESDQTLLNTAEVNGVMHGRIGGIATTSVVIMTLAAPILGYLIHRGVQGFFIYAFAALVCIVGVVAGFYAPVSVSPQLWMGILAGYVFVAGWIPVWLLLQPRDFLNVQLLYGGMALLVLATIVAGVSGVGMQIQTSTISDGTELIGPFWPIMFITIACGAISGFHSLVATGTTVRQIPKESDCRRVGYNSMVLESLLALLVLVAVGSQMNFGEYRASMTSAGGPIQTFAVACGGLFSQLGIPMPIGCVLGILVIEGFIITTLDTSIRLARYLFEELWVCLFARDARRHILAADSMEHPITIPPPRFFTLAAFNTSCAVGMMLLFAYSQDAYKALWPFFGAGNQLIGALTLTTISIWLMKRGKPYWFVALPALFMVITAVSALAWLVKGQFEKEGEPLRLIIVAAGAALLALAIGFVLIAAMRVWQALRRDVKLKPERI